MNYEKKEWTVDSTGALCMGDQQIVVQSDACRDDNVESAKANVLLMAAAPEMFLALRNLGAEIFSSGLESRFKSAMDQALKAMKKAQGEKWI